MHFYPTSKDFITTPTSSRLSLITECPVLDVTLSECVHCGKIYDLTRMQSFPSLAHYERLHGLVDRLTIRRDENKACMAAWSEIRERKAFAPDLPCYRGTKVSVSDAYRDFIAGMEGTATRLIGEISAFALTRMIKALRGFKEAAVAPDDLAQDIVIEATHGLHAVKNASGFVPWLNRICYTTGAKAVNEAIEAKEIFTDLFIVNEDGDVDDNPEIYRGGGLRPVYQRPLPDFIQGEDLEICGCIRDGYSYEKIAKRLGITVHALHSRIHRMKKKVLAAKKAGTID